MIPPTPGFLVAAANAFVGLAEEGGDNRGQVVELFLREVQEPAGQPWCAAFVHHVGYWSHFDNKAKRSSWPLPATASCEALGKFARETRTDRRDARAGDVFLVFSKTMNRFVHTGIVVSVDETYAIPKDHFMYVCTTIEGNTNDDGSANGTTTLRKTRRFNTAVGDRFIRWAEIGYKAEAA